MDEMEQTRRLADVSEELLAIRDGEPVRLRVWEFESVADRLEEDGEDDATPTFGVDEPDPEARARGLVHIAAKLHVDGVDGWAYVNLDVTEDEATVDRESYLNPDHCVTRRIPFSLEDGFRLGDEEYGDAGTFARGLIGLLREELEELGELQAAEETG